MVHSNRTPDRQENHKPKKFDWGAVLVILVFVAALTVGIFAIQKIFEPVSLNLGMFHFRSTFQYRINLDDYPKANVSNTYTVLKFGDSKVEEGNRSYFDGETEKLELRRVFASEGGNDSDRMLRGWVSEPTEFVISIYQSSFNREDGYVLGDLIKQETIRVTPWLFFFYSTEIMDVYVNPDLNWDKY